RDSKRPPRLPPSPAPATSSIVPLRAHLRNPLPSTTPAESLTARLIVKDLAIATRTFPFLFFRHGRSCIRGTVSPPPSCLHLLSSHPSTSSPFFVPSNFSKLTQAQNVPHRPQPDDTLSLLERLSARPGVQGTLVLSRDTGAIVRESGFVVQGAPLRGAEPVGAAAPAAAAAPLDDGAVAGRAGPAGLPGPAGPPERAAPAPAGAPGSPARRHDDARPAPGAPPQSPAALARAAAAAASAAGADGGPAAGAAFGARTAAGQDGAGASGRGQARSEVVARAVFAFVSAAGDMGEVLDPGDDLKLLRLRMKRNELVIVPDQRFLLVVVHDKPRD
ncbi:hypothetical protein BDY21DRAFT_411918, partial [Lineolata rhizophorae]